MYYSTPDSFTYKQRGRLAMRCDQIYLKESTPREEHSLGRRDFGRYLQFSKWRRWSDHTWWKPTLSCLSTKTLGVIDASAFRVDSKLSFACATSSWGRLHYRFTLLSFFASAYWYANQHSWRSDVSSSHEPQCTTEVLITVVSSSPPVLNWGRRNPSRFPRINTLLALDLMRHWQRSA